MDRRRSWKLATLVLLTGALTGLAGVGLRALLGLLERLFWPSGASFEVKVSATSPLYRVGALLLAGIVTTAIRLILRRTRLGPEGVLVTVWERAGIVPLGKTVARSLLSVFDVSLGAALGREGPLKEIGGALASRLGLITHLDLSERRLLVACGTAAGLAAAYNVPLGAALFGLEVLLSRMEVELVAPMIVCCALSTALTRFLLGGAPSYQIPTFHLVGPLMLVQALLLGAILGVLAALVLKGLRWFSTIEEWNARVAPYMLLLALGALGVASAWLPQLLGNGYDVANAALHNELSVSLLLTLPLLRFLATATCSAAQVPGGLFTPVLSIGAPVGGLAGEGIASVWPNTSPGLFALLGMGALLAGTSRGPISSVVLVAELSAHYQLTLPLVFTCTAAAVTCRHLDRGSLYRLGPRRPPPKEPPPKPLLPVHVTRKISELTIAADLLIELLTQDPRPLFVVDERGLLLGSLYPETARQRLAAESLSRLLMVGDLIDRDCPRLSVHATPEAARALFGRDEALRFVPVVDDTGVLLGEACREDFVPCVLPGGGGR